MKRCPCDTCALSVVCSHQCRQSTVCALPSLRDTLQTSSHPHNTTDRARRHRHFAQSRQPTTTNTHQHVSLFVVVVIIGVVLSPSDRSLSACRRPQSPLSPCLCPSRPPAQPRRLRCTYCFLYVDSIENKHFSTAVGSFTQTSTHSIAPTAARPLAPVACPHRPTVHPRHSLHRRHQC